MLDANDLSLEEWQAVVALTRRSIDEDKFPFSDRIRTLHSELHKLDPKSVSPEASQFGGADAAGGWRRLKTASAPHRRPPAAARR